jgi:CubicO group peptidase (beta-lactamase class C family)
MANRHIGWQWQPDTLVNVYSVSKPFAATALLHLVGQGRVDLDAPVARYWPEFAQAGKGAIPVRWLLTHQSGLLALREPQPPEALFDWDRICSLLAAEEPWWPPGTQVGEQAYFFGHLVGEVVRRVTGASLGKYFRRKIAIPWGLDFHIGVRDDDLARVAPLNGVDATWRKALGAKPGSLFALALDNPPGALHSRIVNSAAWRQAEIPAVNGHASARAVARFHAGISDGGILAGVRLLPENLSTSAISIQAEGNDALFDHFARWGLGFQIDVDGFGMGGIGGSLGWGNSDHRFGFGYVTNRMGTHERALSVFEAAARIAGLPSGAG